MEKLLFWGSAVGFGLALAISCSNRAEVNPRLEVVVPRNFPPPVYDFKRNPVTKQGFELGRALFYDGLLSRDGQVSCGFCHQQSAGFTHHGHDLSHGIDDRLGKRNALPIQNMAFYTDFMWDGGIHDLDLQPLAPIENPVEMDEDLSRVVAKLKQHPHYPARFAAAFGSSEITGERMLLALSQFMASLVSGNSRYDRHVRGEGERLTTDELAGMRVFQQKCASCHAGELFTDQSYRNNGLWQEYNQDPGRYDITLQEADKYKFRVPSLRNVEVTRPYMHDGRFRNLEMVLDHYASGVADIPTLDPLLKQPNGRRGIPLTDLEKQQLIAFLGTLTDDDFLRNPRFSEIQ
jgi:cytochrome c peroxidase